jgi:hypothetical protein
MATAHAYKEAHTPPAGTKKLRHLLVKEGEDGGHVVEHHYHESGMVYHKPKEYAFGKDEGEDVMAHIAKHAHIRHASKAEEKAEGEEE